MINLNKRIFITWVTGFVGANLLHRLVWMWASNIHVLIRKDSDSRRITTVLDKITVHTFSLENQEETLTKIREIRPQILFHIAAAGTAVGRAPFTIDELIQANTLGTIHLIDAASGAGCECFIQTGSSSEYGQKDLPMRESDILEPNNLYGLSKAWATQYASYIGELKNFPIATFRPFSIYGPLEEPKRLIPTLIRKYLSWEVPELSTPHSVRDFIYIDDVIDSYLEADRAVLHPGDIINIGGWIQYSIGTVVSFIREITNSQIEPQYGQQKINQNEPTSWVADNEKMQTVLWIHPRPMKDWLLRTIEYYRNGWI